MNCPNGHGELIPIKKPIDVCLLVPIQIIDYLIHQQENGLPPIIFPKIIAICPECGLVYTTEETDKT